MRAGVSAVTIEGHISVGQNLIDAGDVLEAEESLFERLPNLQIQCLMLEQKKIH